jgi:fatty-acyl-CoA synthase
MRAEGHLARREANFQPLTPLDFLQRTVSIYPDHAAVVWRDRRWTYREFAELVGRFAAMLRRAGVRAGDVVSVMAPNRPEMLAAHYAVPMVGAVLSTINIRLDPETIGYILDHSESRLFIVDPVCSGAARQAAAQSGVRVLTLSGGDGTVVDGDNFDGLLTGVEAEPITLAEITDEWQPICVTAAPI